MPNFGRLTDDLFCRTLTVGDRLVLDQNLNLIVGNVIAGNLECVLFTSKIVEQSSLQGITVFGNLHIQNGSYLTGDIDLTGVDFQDLNVFGNVTIGQAATIGGTLRVDRITSDTQPQIVIDANVAAGIVTVHNLTSDGYIATNELFATTISSPTIVGNTTVNGSLTASRLICDETITGVLLVDQLSGKTSNQLDIIGNVTFLDGCLTLSKSTVGPQVSNVVSASTPSGVAIYDVTANTAPQLLTLTMENSCIQGNSVVLATIGNYVGNALPFIQQTFVLPGVVYLNFLILSTAFSGETIPIQYLIV